MTGRHPMVNPRRLVACFYAVDVLIALAFVAHLFLGVGDLGIIARQLHPGREANIPTWYSSIQWALAGGLLAIYAVHAPRHLKRGIRLYLPAVAAFALSIDEAAAIHEWIGAQSDVLLPGGTREGTFFSGTGIWMLILVPIASAVAIWIAVLLIDHLRTAPLAGWLLIGGVAIFLVGVGALELATNVGAGNRPVQLGIQVAEELCEMLGATTVVWGAAELLRSAGIGVGGTDPPADPRAET